MCEFKICSQAILAPLSIFCYYRCQKVVISALLNIGFYQNMFLLNAFFLVLCIPYEHSPVIAGTDSRRAYLNYK